ncbi:hypothetical protein GCM10007235_20400 [Pseudoxanthomonas indica]|nr:hypothetical protein GCM10007235_20400 [Pseudoxanthomonas indica]
MLRTVTRVDEMELLQSLLQGVTSFCVPGPRCHPDWTAWGAIITFLAVLVPAMQHERSRTDERKSKIRRGRQAIEQFAAEVNDLAGQIDSHRQYLPAMPRFVSGVGPQAIAGILRLRISIPQFDPIEEFEQITQACSNLSIGVKAFNQLIDLGLAVPAVPGVTHVFSNVSMFESMLDEIDRSLQNVMHAMESTVPGSTSNIRRRHANG